MCWNTFSFPFLGGVFFGLCSCAIGAVGFFGRVLPSKTHWIQPEDVRSRTWSASCYSVVLNPWLPKWPRAYRCGRGDVEVIATPLTNHLLNGVILRVGVEFQCELTEVLGGPSQLVSG